jgi:hypothetical protein
VHDAGADVHVDRHGAVQFLDRQVIAQLGARLRRNAVDRHEGLRLARPRKRRGDDVAQHRIGLQQVGQLGGFSAWNAALAR